jgi:aminoglycoside phosphotransferase (APT) family kinase protein
MWLDEERLVLFDFDEFTLGDPMEDVAALVTRLQAAGADAVFINALLGAYVQAAPARFCRERLDWHVKVQHLLQASRAFVFQVQNWRHEVERRLARAEALCFAASEARAA